MKSNQQIAEEAQSFKIAYMTWMIVYKGKKFHEEYWNLNWRK